MNLPRKNRKMVGSTGQLAVHSRLGRGKPNLVEPDTVISGVLKKKGRSRKAGNVSTRVRTAGVKEAKCWGKGFGKYVRGKKIALPRARNA